MIQEPIFFNFSHINQKTTFTDPRLAFAIEDNSFKTVPQRFRYDANSTTLQVLHGKDLSGKFMVVTGACCGLGKYIFSR